MSFIFAFVFVFPLSSSTLSAILLDQQPYEPPIFHNLIGVTSSSLDSPPSRSTPLDGKHLIARCRGIGAEVVQPPDSAVLSDRKPAA